MLPREPYKGETRKLIQEKCP
ncbi:hypothetical protein AZE42_10333 [Rhizopogon vesiculosus]|uniref:Uncharacterized protein n=1 Tax=Rhizopogon vesiculosus TaxID=180088 RepID=A0A1J8QH43_9AGAM|nr:hypothetical protein AZE42_10333 [Rhizopogon vesiculosus]